MKSERMLISILIDFINKDLYFKGMCSAINELHYKGELDYIERRQLHNIINDNIHECTILNLIKYKWKTVKMSSKNGYWWRIKDKEPRIKYLQYLLDKKYK